MTTNYTVTVIRETGPTGTIAFASHEEFLDWIDESTCIGNGGFCICVIVSLLPDVSRF